MVQHAGLQSMIGNRSDIIWKGFIDLIGSWTAKSYATICDQLSKGRALPDAQLAHGLLYLEGMLEYGAKTINDLIKTNNLYFRPLSDNPISSL